MRAGLCWPLDGRVHGAERAADAPADERDVVGARRALRLAHAPRQRVADVVVEAGLAVLVVRDAPVEQIDVEALVEQVLDERVPRPQVEDVGPVDQREHKQHRHRVLALARAVAVQRRLAVRPDDVTRRGADPRVLDGEHDVGQLDRARRQARDALHGAHDLRGVERRGFAAAVRGALGALPVEFVLELLDPLQKQLELVLRAVELAREPGDVAAAGDAQVAKHEIAHIGADLAQGDEVLRHPSEQLAEALACRPAAPSRPAVCFSAPSYRLRTCSSGVGVDSRAPDSAMSSSLPARA